MTFPTDVFSGVVIEQITDTRVSKTRYYRNRARGNKAPFFMVALTSPPLPYSEYMATMAVIESYEGALEIFALPNPLPALAAFPDYALDVTANAGSKTVILDRQANYRAGDLIQFSSHAKAYRIASVSIGSGVTTIGLSCPLLETVLTSDDVLYGANVIFQVCLEDVSPMDIQASQSKFGVIDVELIEQA